MTALNRQFLGAAVLAALGGWSLQANAEWPLALGTTGDTETDRVVASETSPTGDVIVTGHFTGSMETELGRLISNGGQDVFVARIAQSGQLLWIESGGSEVDDEVFNIAVDDGDNVYIAGRFEIAARFGGDTLVSSGLGDGYLAKINASGDWQWARRIGGAEDDWATAVATLPGDNTQIPSIPASVIVGGTYQCEAEIDDPDNPLSQDDPLPDLAGLDCADSRDVFLVRYSSNGDGLWALDRDGLATGFETVEHIDVDNDGRAWVTGTAADGGVSALLSDNFNRASLGTDWSSNNTSRGSIRQTSRTLRFEDYIGGIWQTWFPFQDSYSVFDGNPALALREDSVTVTSRAFDTTGQAAIRLDFDFMAGRSSPLSDSASYLIFTGYFTAFGLISEYPDAGEDMYVEFFGSDNKWHLVEYLPGGTFTSGAIKRYSGDNSFSISDAKAFHSGFRLRFRRVGGSGTFSLYRGPNLSRLPGQYDWHHVDNVGLQSRGPEIPIIFSVSNADGASPTVEVQRALSTRLDVRDARLNADGTRLIVVGRASDDVALGQACAPVSGPGIVLASYDVTGLSAAECVWAGGVSGNASAEGVAVDDAGNLYVTGWFDEPLAFSLDATLNPRGDRDVFIASWLSGANLPDVENNQFAFNWATGGGEFNEDTGIPAFSGGFARDTGFTIATDGSSKLYVGGSFEDTAVFGEDATVTALVGADPFIANLSTDGLFFEELSWAAGVPLVPPPNAELTKLAFQPEFQVDGEPFDAISEEIFSWSKAESEDAKLIPLQPFGKVEVLWRVAGLPAEDDRRISSIGTIAWPTEPCSDTQSNNCYQVHVVDAPVQADPANGQYKTLRLVDPRAGSSNPTLEAGRFNASRTGTATLVYVRGPEPDVNLYSTEVEIVRTVSADSTPLTPDDTVPAEIGRPITDPHHEEISRTGFVANELAYYDGFGPDAAYNRASRTGDIIPVNRINPGRTQDVGRQLVVAWYHRKNKGVFWPEKGVIYEPFWPLDPERIIIASEQGSEVLGQAPLDPLVFDSARIYSQDDRTKPGYNPNDEHALLAPSSTGTPFEAVFALRSDFGANLEGDDAAASDPYVLVKYFDSFLQQWKFRVFKVEATGAGYSSFRFDGTAGTTVAPPYPVSLLGGCGETFAVGQSKDGPPPPPFFEDYKFQLWAASSGTGGVRYYYPTQPGWVIDLDNNDVNDITSGTCVPWLARLPEERGGSGSELEPIVVNYDITWPDDIPLLISGETLLTPKRGLPDIFNQDAVQVVFDQLQATKENPLPSDTLAQLIAPLTPRSVSLSAIPGEIASELRTDGTRKILGSSDGQTKLPASIRQRLSYDPLTKRLILTGVFDESGIGEPFLLLNVLSKRDRVDMKILDGGDGSEASGSTKTCQAADSGCSWDEAVEALFRFSRNPQGIEKICRDSDLNEDRELVCNDSVPVDEDDVLIGLQDEIGGTDGSGDGILEPYLASGVRPALTAGASQGSGFMTVAFNNDPELNPLPVSLQIIEVGCLASPPDVPNPDILSTYQGQIQVIEPDNIFDEQLVLRHSGDFGGNPDGLDFQWFFHPDVDGNPPLPLPDPSTGQLSGWIQYPVDDPRGAVSISIEGANIQTLSDNWYAVRYRGLPTCGNRDNWSIFAGDPTATPAEPSPQLAEGWVKRVLKRLNPFEARVQDFAKAATNNFASMLVQLGERYEGPIPLTNDPEVLNSLGLIEAYTTVMERALDLSVEGTPPVDYGPANNAILLVASRIVDFYTLLGNEAFADAQDPSIGIKTSDDSYLSLAPTIFNFQNQMASVLEEELTLLRGRDKSLGGVAGRPVYNRLFWNFTTGDGEVAYAQSYNISDQNVDGVIDEFDARILYPQGHGDAWGHYLTATDIYYNLLREEYYSWNPRIESILVAGAPINVDFLDERQFAETAAAKARTGAEIVDLTYRSEYVADPQGQYQGYQDNDEDRAWGLAEWGSRAGMGAYFDWVTVNAILPSQDPDPNAVGIERVDRTTVDELDEISGYFADIQEQVDEADGGLNPLGLADNVVIFDMDPTQLDRFNRTNTEQVLARADAALDNAVQVWDFANELSNQMRRNQNEVEDLQRASRAQENDFSNQLIEIFGTPYTDDIGGAGTYPAGYNGPDVYNYMMIDVPTLAGTAFDFDEGFDGFDADSAIEVARINKFTGVYKPTPNGINFFDWTTAGTQQQRTGSGGQSCASEPLSDGCALGSLDVASDPSASLEVEYETIESPGLGFWFTKKEGWTGDRRAPGQLQQILQQKLQARIALRKAVVNYDRLRREIEAKIDELRVTFAVAEENLNLQISQRKELKNLTIAVETMKATAVVARRAADQILGTTAVVAECVPKNFVAGLAAGGDVTSAARCGLEGAGIAAQGIIDIATDALDIAASATDAAKEDVGQKTGIKTAINDAELDLYNLKGEIDQMIREEPVLRAEIFARSEAIKQHVNDYRATLARGLRVMERLKSFRKNGAAAVQEYRYQDLAFRIFRNDALQKYRASFDLAARYVYLAAQAYDYDTNLLGGDTQAGQEFLTDIVRERSLGQILDGVPQPGSPGLASKLAEMRLNFDVLKGQMGFNNPQVETNRFSLREELFRIPPGPEGDAEWRAKLSELRVDDLWSVQEFQRYARPFAPQSAGPQPGLVIEFPTDVTFGLNFFGWELGPGDSSYDSSQFSTRVRSVGSWFGNYANLPLADDPRIYLIPVGADVLRSPDAFDFRTREWQIVEQVMPVPFPINQQELERFDWTPTIDTLSGSATQTRRYGRFRAYHLTEPFDDTQVTADSRLIGRSVWNTRWVMIIPGGTFLNDPVEGMDTFVHGRPLPDGSGERDGQGVSDILIFFKTYAYSGF